MTEPAHVPAPGSRVHAAAHAAAQAAPRTASQPPQEAPGAVASVPVHHTAPAPVYTAPASEGNYGTVMIPVSAAGAASVQRVLPRDDDRVQAWLVATDGPVIVATALETAQNPANAGLTGYAASGAWIPQGLLIPVTHREPVYACNPSTSAAVHVSVLAQTGGAAQSE